MKQLSFKNRIAFNYIISTALLVFAVFFVIYSSVKFTVFNDVKKDIRKEIGLHLREMKFEKKTIVWINKEEWEEKEHNEANVNPVFVEIKDLNGVTIEKSPNLKKDELEIQTEREDSFFYQTILNNQQIQLSQTPIFHKNNKKGYLLIAMSLEHPLMLLKNLRTILFILYPIVLIVLFIIARIIAGRSIKPINSIIGTTNLITKDNLKYRIELPKNRDELYQLSGNINSLLDRIENAVEREKQFTSDASHELRTPLSVIKGTLEVLIRKEREKKEYEEKIKFCISEVDRLNILVDELLLLARFENQKQHEESESVYLNALILDVLARFSELITSRNVKIVADFNNDFYIESDYNMVSIILSNLISNALKYCDENGTVILSIENQNQVTELKITNSGKGISKEELDKVFNPFYRSASLDLNKVKGVGLGLSIVKRLCDLLQIQISIESNSINETTVKLNFNN
ncbi:HAMP domain-containing histidine kinase [Flavobacterium sp. SM15]|uniref:sensor histidine kinase n=1 Tax=Flavobacterium sp. SM15 TaxID=2908005 RepID=UPI001EDA9E94|nr:HAMP domain-containing sensor histidine kinase [Flavobacterium sp. SM15]MCG2611686.1 HAMP domain-containing histidine kinase [Flavobacterium sp. SM15]